MVASALHTATYSESRRLTTYIFFPVRMIYSVHFGNYYQVKRWLYDSALGFQHLITAVTGGQNSRR